MTRRKNICLRLSSFRKDFPFITLLLDKTFAVKYIFFINFNFANLIIIMEAEIIWNKRDYDDFFIVSKDETIKQIERAKILSVKR